MGACSQCGAPRIADGPTICPFCHPPRNGRPERLFEPAPTVIPGQTTLVLQTGGP